MKNRTLLYLLLIIPILLCGCARTALIRRSAPSEVITKEIPEPNLRFKVGERLTYLVAWKGIPVGIATATIEELMTFKEYEVYKIVVVAKTNDFQIFHQSVKNWQDRFAE